ncbi:hypothetical protein VE04_08315 [Pseudogymnoascus sp. 24MN13]|nr:hypothetical protein VE04_08315 [Pseudogymnoascus sp. 24MN13]
MADQVTLQADVGNVPTNALALLGAAQPLLKALSADNISALAVLQAQALGDQFLSNGDWALRLPDLLARASSVRLERLSAWIGWQKGDTASYMSRSSGGRTVSLLCLALGNLYAKERCGMILRGLSSHVIQGDQQNSSISQLSDLNACLSDKLSCLGFGNLLALHLTRLRQSFFEAGRGVPTDLADIPTEETMVEFLVGLHRALQSEELTLSFTGSKGAGPLLALLMCLCPEDTRVEVEGELIHQGTRSSVTFSVTGHEHNGSSFCIGSKIRAHSEDFSRRFVQTDDSNEPHALNFKWTGWLSSCLDIALAKVGASANGNVREALANLTATAVFSLSGHELCSLDGEGFFRLPKNGMRTLLGPEYDFRVRRSLSTILMEPTDLECRDIVSSYAQLKTAVSLVIPHTSCSCGLCSDMEHWNDIQHPKSGTSLGKTWQFCQIARFWATLGDILERGYISSLIEARGEVAIGHVQRSKSASPRNKRVLGSAIARAVQLKTSSTCENRYSVASVQFIHRSILSMVDAWNLRLDLDGQEYPPIVCQSSGQVTVFPATLQYPRITNPWMIEYLLVDGKLQEGPNSYSAVICARTQRGDSKKLKRPKVGVSLLPKKAKITPSSLGEHNLLSMTLQSEVIERIQVLLLRSRIQSSTKSCHVNFLDVHLGFLGLTPADVCDHTRHSALDAEFTEGVMATSVQAPAAKGANILALTLTHWNPESQFLCCSTSSPALYQGSCCLTCAVAQAREEKIGMVIGGND